MALETGDIIIFSKGFGHVAMVYDSKHAIHGQMKGNFHLELLQTEKNNQISYFSGGGKVYKFPWDKYGAAAKVGYQTRIQNVANRIMRSAKYGAYRAIRLKLGSSSFGSGAYSRLIKYRERLSKPGDKFVSTITCSEATMLCFQLTFLENGGPGFIRLDAAHTMPATLGKWLAANWGEPSKG